MLRRRLLRVRLQSPQRQQLSRPRAVATSSDQEGLNKARRSAALGNAREIARRLVPRDLKGSRD